MHRAKSLAKGLFFGATGVTAAVLYYRTQTLVGSCLADDFERATRLAHQVPSSILARDMVTGLTPMRAAMRKARNGTTTFSLFFYFNFRVFEQTLPSLQHSPIYNSCNYSPLPSQNQSMAMLSPSVSCDGSYHRLNIY